MKTKLITVLICITIGSVAMLTIVVLQNEDLTIKNKYLEEQNKTYEFTISELTKCNEGD